MIDKYILYSILQVGKQKKIPFFRVFPCVGMYIGRRKGVYGIQSKTSEDRTPDQQDILRDRSSRNGRGDGTEKGR